MNETNSKTFELPASNLETTSTPHPDQPTLLTPEAQIKDWAQRNGLEAHSLRLNTGLDTYSFVAVELGKAAGWSGNILFDCNTEQFYNEDTGEQYAG